MFLPIHLIVTIINESISLLTVLNLFHQTNISMTDLTNKELVKQVQSSLSKYINKPQLTDKLLNKPPFKFLHDIVTNVSIDFSVCKKQNIITI